MVHFFFISNNGYSILNQRSLWVYEIPEFCFYLYYTQCFNFLKLGLKFNSFVCVKTQCHITRSECVLNLETQGICSLYQSVLTNYARMTSSVYNDILFCVFPGNVVACYIITVLMLPSWKLRCCCIFLLNRQSKTTVSLVITSCIPLTGRAVHTCWWSIQHHEASAVRLTCLWRRPSYSK